MKLPTIILTVLSVCLMFTNVAAQITRETPAYDETLWNVKKRKMIIDHMNMTEAEKAAFWTVYESYSSAIQFIDYETLQIIAACNDTSYELDEKELEQYSKKKLQNDLLLDRARIQYYKKFCKALSPARASEFMQLDDNLRMMLRMEVQSSAQSSSAAQASIR